jgi:hypothetical protein
MQQILPKWNLIPPTLHGVNIQKKNIQSTDQMSETLCKMRMFLSSGDGLQIMEGSSEYIKQEVEESRQGDDPSTVGLVKELILI